MCPKTALTGRRVALITLNKKQIEVESLKVLGPNSEVIARLMETSNKELQD
jgi:hypothetical protein